MSQTPIEPPRPMEQAEEAAPSSPRERRARANAAALITAGCVLGLPLVIALLTMPGPKGRSIFTAAPVQSTCMVLGLVLVYFGIRGLVRR